MSRTLLIDGDSVCYSAGCCSTERDTELYVDNKIRQIIDACGSSKLTGWVEQPKNKSNFRNHVAVTLPYKGHRSDDKPEFLTHAKRYAVDQYGFRWATWLESEDHVLIAATKLGYDNVTICGIDKDLLQVPCLFYNYDRPWKVNGQVFVKFSKEQAMHHLYSQFLTGDKSSDNIPGLYGVGPGKANALLSCDIETWPQVVARAYIERGYTYHYLVEQCRLLYLLRDYNDLFMFPMSAEEYTKLEQEIKEARSDN